MDENVEIDVQEDIVQEQSTVQLPINFITIGEIENDDVKVYIKQDIYNQIERLSASDTTKELGSILLGEYYEELNKMHVVISEFVEAKHTDASASTLTFTHGTWDYVHREHDNNYPQLKMLGWQHTHPSYGIFLSNYDMFIQENFFTLPFQIAYVVDPIQGIRGFFQWKSGKIEKLKGFYVYDDVGKPIKIEQSKKNDADKKVAKSSKPLIIAMTALLAIFAVTTAILFVQLSKQIEEQNRLQADINEQSRSIQTLQDTVSQTVGATDQAVQINELIERIESQQILIDNQEVVLAELRERLADEEASSADVSFITYTVKEGDRLFSICTAFGLDYRANIEAIKELNGITNENLIITGQTLILPGPNTP